MLESFLSNWMVLLGACTICYVTSSIIYNLYFNPLASYPGPFLARISSLPSFYYATTGYRHIWIWQCHQLYGQRCRIQPNEVIFNSASAYRSIYGNKANVRKGDIYKVWRQKLNVVSTLTEVDNTTHARKKRLLTAAFTDKAIRSAETFIIQHVDRFCDLLDGPIKTNEPQNMAELADYLVFDIMCDLSFGKSFDLKEPRPNPLKTVPHTFDNFTIFMSNIARSPLLPAWLWLKTKGLNAILERAKPKDMGILFALIRTNVLQRLKEETQDPEAAENGRKDMFHYLFHTKDSESGGRAYSEDDLAIEAGLLLTTALGATSTTLSAFYFYITRNSYIYKKLIEEIRATFTSADDIHGSAVLSCSYLRACLDETLRMTPASPSEAIRIVLPGGLEVDRQFLPEGVAVGSSSWSLFHDDSYFRDPWVYRPERWIVDEALGVSAADVARAQLAFLPFSIGPVNCVGQKLARSILLVTIAKTLFRFDVASPQGDKVGEGSDHLGWGRRDRNVFQVRDATFALRQGPMVCFKEREIT